MEREKKPGHRVQMTEGKMLFSVEDVSMLSANTVEIDTETINKHTIEMDNSFFTKFSFLKQRNVIQLTINILAHNLFCNFQCIKGGLL